jgi:Na+/glutamate symporter
MLSRTRKLIAVFCVAALFLAALAPAISGVVYAVLVPLDPLFGMVVVGSAVSTEQGGPQPRPFSNATGSRAPPAA